MCIVLHAMMIMTDTDVLEAEVMTEEDQEVGPLITTIEDLIVWSHVVKKMFNNMEDPF